MLEESRTSPHVTVDAPGITKELESLCENLSSAVAIMRESVSSWNTFTVLRTI